MPDIVSRDIQERIDAVWIVDTHEHLPSEKARLETDPDPLLLFLSHYASADVVSAGLHPEDLERARDLSLPLGERWALVEPYWKRAANTGYCRAVLHVVQDLYDIPALDITTIDALAEAMRQRNRPGLYRWVLKERSRIAVSILDSDPDADPEFFISVYRLDDFLVPDGPAAIEALERKTGRSIHGLDDLEKAMEEHFQWALGKGIGGLKSGLAYQRPIEYRKRARHEAEEILQRILAGEVFPRSPGLNLLNDGIRPLGDYMMHRLLGLIRDAGVPFQIHTGLQEGNGNDIRNADPKLLIPLFAGYPGVKFDVFHSGYPFLSDLAAIAKNFQNVYVDMCWMHVISPTAARRALSEYLDAVPANKILGFGGDYLYVEGVYGHQRIARRNIASVLSEKICDGYLSVDDAGEIALRLLQRNAVELFRIPRKMPPESVSVRESDAPGKDET